MIQDVLDDPAMPVFWGKNQKGMQAVEELTVSERNAAINAWILARDEAVYAARAMAKSGLHKQIVNRIIEPWCHINVVVTATEWANFFALRRHKDAQPEMRALADAMWAAREASTPALLHLGQWHLPYVSTIKEIDLLPSAPKDYPIASGDRYREDSWFRNLLIKLSVARCARVSYLTHEGKPPNVVEDLALHDRLLGSIPLHASPAEHQATPDTGTRLLKHPDGHASLRYGWEKPKLHGNFVGWRQRRKMLANENVTDC